MPGPLSPEQIAWLDDLRSLLIAGWIVLALWFAVTLARERPDISKPYELCKLHQRPTHECRDQHSEP